MSIKLTEQLMQIEKVKTFRVCALTKNFLELLLNKVLSNQIAPTTAIVWLWYTKEYFSDHLKSCAGKLESNTYFLEKYYKLIAETVRVVQRQFVVFDDLKLSQSQEHCQHINFLTEENIAIMKSFNDDETLFKLK